MFRRFYALKAQVLAHYDSEDFIEIATDRVELYTESFSIGIWKD